MQPLIKLKLNIIVIGLMLIPGQGLQAESLQLPPPYHASYQLLKNGIPVANADFVLKYDEQRIHFSSVSKVSGLAAMFRKDEIHESSVLDRQHNPPRLIEYQYRHTGGKKKRAVSIRIDWQSKTAQTINDGKSTNTPVTEPLWDRFSIQLPIMHAAGRSHDKQQFKVIDKNQLKVFTVEYLGHEKIETNLDQWIETDQWQSQAESSTRKTVFWLAPNQHYLPIKIEQYKNGDLNATLLLSNVQWQPTQP